MSLKNFWSSKKILLPISLLFLNLLIISPAFAAAGDYTPLVKIPGINVNAGLLPYLNGVYKFLISIIGILAMAVLVYGGMRYITSAGNTASVEEAKDSINSALIGLLLALISWVIFSTINPDILVLKPVGVGLPGGKYGDAGKNPLSNCVASPLGNGTSDNPCKCIDNPTRDVTFTQPALTGPYVVSTSIAPCAVGVPANTSSITFTFNEPLDPSTIVTSNTNSNLITVLGGFAQYTPSTTVTTTLNGNNLVITWPGSTLNAGTRHTFIIKGIVDRGGAPNDAWVKNLSGVGMTRNYWVTFVLEPAFTGVACSSALPPIITCRVACSNNYTPSVSGLNPPGYHCIKADLRVGSTFMPIGKQVSVKAGDTVYFDGRTYSANYAYPNLKTDVSSDGPGFDNGVDSYEIDFTTPWIKWSSDYAMTESLNCSFLPGLVSALGTALFDIQYTKGMVSTSYDTAGTYEGLLRIQSKNGCYEAFDRVKINVNP